MDLDPHALPAVADSPIARLDPRWKLVAVAVAVAAVGGLTRPMAAAVAGGGALGLVAAGRLPWAWYGRRLAPVAAGVVPFAAGLVLLGADPAWSLGPLRLSEPGTRAALLIAGKALAMTSLALIVLATAPPATTLAAAHAVGVPGLLVRLVLLTGRYVALLAEELNRLRVAVRVRAFRAGVNAHTYRTVGHVAGALLVRSADRADRVGYAMACRGFDGRFRTLTDFRTRPADVAFFALTVGAAVALFAADRLAGGRW